MKVVTFCVVEVFVTFLNNDFEKYGEDFFDRGY